ncbi:uncharacterized protein LOC131052404 isoform X2 [Cryptomeria japonica]|uniref:uncharacterized protein LOC131052404 isoform X2 n=1 Tax=Cryptomeria japonica TaxID=3369 RepID=UPI0027D9DDA2|nr:uncharacterized protein LOC131052404 isoform X2 [Cryptomeria japonica]
MPLSIAFLSFSLEFLLFILRCFHFLSGFELQFFVLIFCEFLFCGLSFLMGMEVGSSKNSSFWSDLLELWTENGWTFLEDFWLRRILEMNWRILWKKEDLGAGDLDSSSDLARNARSAKIFGIFNNLLGFLGGRSPKKMQHHHTWNKSSSVDDPERWSKVSRNV